ncbi:ABC transporter ATP-binding protein [Paenibacillus sp. YPG26]|uniref:ABC transporter ATP-binding protein n=1 Tax=Paenibacillus sp. YPG26 TaxID=2878915 RepID=UPI00204217EE|nr:ABC transporter ATP-binding protein [Paenibacillus sp. YPG26]USB34992.1 ABC transporter ATP-binding protein [Paenibacillus sp. YPG26]
MIELRGITKRIGHKTVLRDLNLKVEQGQFLGVIGPNGSGKTTLLHTISGVEHIESGEIDIDGKPVGSYRRRELARKLAVLQQDGIPSLAYPVKDVIEMGRFPFLDWLGRDLSSDAGQIIDRIMMKLDLDSLADQPVDELSGGQRQRVALGKVMAQQPRVLLLDEPTTYLDIRYQLQFMELVSEWQKDEDLTVVAVMHDLNLASMYCDRLVALQEGSIAAEGTPQDILTPDTLKRVFEVESALARHPDLGVPQIMLRREESYNEQFTNGADRGNTYPE